MTSPTSKPVKIDKLRVAAISQDLAANAIHLPIRVRDENSEYSAGYVIRNSYVDYEWQLALNVFCNAGTFEWQLRVRNMSYPELTELLNQTVWSALLINMPNSTAKVMHLNYDQVCKVADILDHDKLLKSTEILHLLNRTFKSNKNLLELIEQRLPIGGDTLVKDWDK